MTFITAMDRPDLYGSGHAQAEDFKYIAKLVAPKTVIPVHCSQKMAETLIFLAKSQNYQTMNRPVRNGETLHISSETGIERVDSKVPEWYGLRHPKNQFGDTTTEFHKVPDNGFSIPKTKSFKEKRLEADKKIAEYKNQHKNAGLLHATRRNANER